MSATPLPNLWYYLDNFEFVLGWVAQRYSDLLNETERGFIDDFIGLERSSRALLVRMVMRKGSLFRASKLNYAEIGQTRCAMAPLLDLGWVLDQPNISLQDLFRLLTRTEIAQLFEPLLASADLKTATKGAQLEHLLAGAPAPRSLAQWLEFAAVSPDASHTESARTPALPDTLSQDSIYHVDVLALCDRLRLMFFGNLRQDWSEFVLADLGLYTYERVDFSAEARAFVSREEVNDYLHLHQCRETLELAQDDVAFAEALAAIPVRPYTSDWLESRRARLWYRAGQHCERRQNWPRALDCYAASTERNARARHIRMLERQHQYPQALDLAQAVLQHPKSEAEHQAVLRMLPRLQKRCGHPASLKPARCPARLLHLNLHVPAIPTRVEEQVCNHLYQPDAPAYYVENTLLNSLFGLLCWNAIFASIPGAFFHPFQHGPADLLHSNFRERRRALFSDCLAQLTHGDYRQTIMRNFNTKQGMQSPFVSWNMLSPELLGLALCCIPANHLRVMFSRLLDDIRENRSGLPDLVQFWPADRRYRLIEVKGPGDRLQDNQVRWLTFCEAHGIDTLVCHVKRPAST